MRSIKIFMISAFMILLMAGCGGDSIKEESSNEYNTEKHTEETKELDKIKEKIDSMTLEQKIGQLFIVGFEGDIINDEIIDLVNNQEVGGLIYFSRNVVDSNQIITLNNEIKDIKKDIPLFISVDEEGGVVSRVPDEFLKLPSSGYIGKFDDENLSYNIGSIISKELKSLGFNMDFAPVLDIDSNPNNTVIGERAFGNNADIVSKLGIKTMEGLRDGGIIPVVKHFPGHGDTDIDSHYGLPIVTKTLEELNNLEFIPFKNAIENGADVVMVSSIILSSIDSEYPATMSKKVTTDILRNKLNFDGVIATDDMTMGAIMDNYNLTDAVIMAINAGNDLILVCHGYDDIIKSISAVKDAVSSNIISEERIDESVYRILKLKEKYRVNDDIISNEIDIEGINLEINSLLN
ncbi:beta-N-acetylhexosaminidase [Clostridium sp. NSJ-145]|uniref:beta-N-acetylhexosaminidase n=1 Tax=Clostridium sp. NSJ-145 TaxID=2897777 RepID=UPI001E5E3292|nr:beta-N-acetylhexosaminidase [Clostridium sp. NSJ-145]MCD2500583.1 beta-N-acetylhexosaminidase [Clostridium sp. NSJ-145]MDU6340056.1 beta-N-acetylhexosaminidase [Clostridium sp.]